MPIRLALALPILFAGTLPVQWITYPTAGIPRTPGGKPNLNAPAPRTAFSPAVAARCSNEPIIIRVTANPIPDDAALLHRT